MSADRTAVIRPSVRAIFFQSLVFRTDDKTSQHLSQISGQQWSSLQEVPFPAPQCGHSGTDGLHADSAFVCARIRPDLTTFGRATYQGSVPLRDLRLNTSYQKWSTRCSLSRVTAQHF